MDVTVSELFRRFAALVAAGQGHIKVTALILPSSKMEDLAIFYGYCKEHECVELHIIDPEGLLEEKEEEQHHSMDERTPFESMLETDAAEFWKKFGID
jgi:hypothetical protein